jgi:hypothetical protein
MKIVTVSATKSEEFESKVNALLAVGCEIVSISCGTVQSEAYDFCDFWMAVLKQNT